MVESITPSAIGINNAVVPVLDIKRLSINAGIANPHKIPIGFVPKIFNTNRLFDKIWY